MRVRELMTTHPATCSTEATLAEVGRLMIEHDCGLIPVLDSISKRVVGVVTDRDVVCRAVASGRDVSATRAARVMTSPVVSVDPDDSLETAVALMKRKQIRRLLVTDARGSCIGILSEADIAQHAPASFIAELLRAVTKSQRLQYA